MNNKFKFYVIIFSIFTVVYPISFENNTKKNLNITITWPSGIKKVKIPACAGFTLHDLPGGTYAINFSIVKDGTMALSKKAADNIKETQEDPIFREECEYVNCDVIKLYSYLLLKEKTEKELANLNISITRENELISYYLTGGDKPKFLEREILVVKY